VTVNDLQKRRKAVLRRMKMSATLDNPLDLGQVQKVNDAYEFLKADLEDTYEGLFICNLCLLVCTIYIYWWCEKRATVYL
jgi:hypothetical protein